MKIEIAPIGYFHSDAKSFYDVPRQSGLIENKGTIELLKGYEFEKALEGLDQFDLIWVFFLFNQSSKWKTKVLPPRGGKKQGVFATRSPHRPNFIGFSCVKLLSINGLILEIANHDLLDGTPIMDLKPYLNYADSRHSEKQGWIADLQCEKVDFQWSKKAQAQLHYLADRWNCHLKDSIEQRLSLSPVPYPNHRVKHLCGNEYELAYKTWRISYILKEGNVNIQSIKSGYDQATLLGEKKSKWEDVPIHQAFINHFK